MNIRAFDRVITLTLIGPDFTDESVSKLHDLRQLESLSLQRTSISNEWVKQFQAANPNCEIFRPAP